jgi:hypothetical protein
LFLKNTKGEGFFHFIKELTQLDIPYCLIGWQMGSPLGWGWSLFQWQPIGHLVEG